MAITIQKQPLNFQPAYNELIYVVSSTNTGLTNFKFVCDVWLEGGSSYIARVKLNTRPGTSQCVFDAHRIIENYLSSDVAETAGFALNSNSWARVLVKFGEEYGSTPSVTANLATSNTITVYNGVFDWPDYVDYNPTAWQLSTSATNTYLTNAPATRYIELSQSALLYYAVSGGSVVASARIKTYNSVGTLLGTYTITNSLISATQYLQRLGCGTRDLNNATLATGSQPVITSSVDHYTIELLSGGSAVVAPVITYYITSNCRYTTYRLHFMNKLGGYDAFNFGMVSRRNTDIQRQSYRQNTGTFSTSSPYWANSKQDKGATVYDVKITDKLTLTSDWISEAESLWLEELFTSPDVYLESGTALIPYTVMSNSYQVKKKESEKLINITIEVAPAVPRTRQRG